MDAASYTYNGQSWTPSATMEDKNSFFHSAFGTSADGKEPYFDKRAKFRRMRWSTFLTFFEHETMPPSLINILKNCLSTNDKYKNVSIEDKDQFGRYIYDIMFGERAVGVAEIPIIATLENATIVLLTDNASNPHIIIKPNIDILGGFINAPEKPKEAVLRLKGNIFQRLERADEKSGKKVEAAKNKSPDKVTQRFSKCLIKYEKLGCAGSKGVEFQVGLLTVFALNAFRGRLDIWRLSTENKRAGKFDDVVLESSKGDILVQAKHKENKTKITLEDLMSVNPKNDDFGLPKYFVSYREIKDKFKIKNVLICTNAGFHCKVSRFLRKHTVPSESLLHYEGADCSYYTFNEKILPYLRVNINTYPAKSNSGGFDETVITDESLQDFLNHLQFYSELPSGSSLEKVTEQILSQSNLHRPASSSDVYAKVMSWYKEKMGVYLTEWHVKAIFAEIWRDRYWQTLEQYKVSFQSNDLILQQSSRVVHVATDDGYFLQELKLYRTPGDKLKTLYVRYDDGVRVQKQVMESFGLPRYTSLIIIWPEPKEELTREIGNELREILHEYEYKKVIVVTGHTSKIVSQIHEDCSVVKSSVVLEDFSEDTRVRLLTKKNITFQGRDVSLEELVGNQKIPDWSKVLYPELLEKLIRGENIRVGLPLTGLDEQTVRFYVKRQFKRKIEENDKTQKKSFPRNLSSRSTKNRY